MAWHARQYGGWGAHYCSIFFYVTYFRVCDPQTLDWSVIDCIENIWWHWDLNCGPLEPWKKVLLKSSWLPWFPRFWLRGLNLNGKTWVSKTINTTVFGLRNSGMCITFINYQCYLFFTEYLYIVDNSTLMDSVKGIVQSYLISLRRKWWERKQLRKTAFYANEKKKQKPNFCVHVFLWKKQNHFLTTIHFWKRENMILELILS